MYTVQLGRIDLDLAQLDQVIHRQIPAGFNIRKTQHEYAAQVDLSQLRCRDFVDINRGYLSVGTLGGGNHFIEVNRDSEGCLYLVVHSGSRNLGKQVVDHYQKLAYDRLRRRKVKIPKALSYLEGKDFQDYLHDMDMVQSYAEVNRRAMADTILQEMGLEAKDAFTTIHNYIDMAKKILRKGAISAQEGERVLIPLNMRDGSIIAVGKGNSDWNFSAPHGAGRLMSRNQAKADLSLEEFKKVMSGIYSTSVSKATLDEAPMAYKPIDEILKHITDTVTVIDIIKPIYNFKAH